MKKIVVIFICIFVFWPQVKAETSINPGNVSYKNVNFRVAGTNGSLIRLAVFCTIKECEQERSSNFDPKTRIISYSGAASIRVDSLLDTIYISTGVKSLLYEHEIIDAYLNAGKSMPWTRPMKDSEKRENWSGTFYFQEQLFAAGNIYYDPNTNFVLLKSELAKTTKKETNNDTILWLISVILLPFMIWIAIKLEDYEEDDLLCSIVARAKNKIVRFLLIGLFRIWQVVLCVLIVVGMVLTICAMLGIFALALDLNPIFAAYIFMIIIFLIIDDKIKSKQKAKKLINHG